MPVVERCAKRATEALAEAHGVDVSESKGVIWVYPAGGEMDNDPYEGDHYCDTWEDAHKRVKEYIRVTT